MKHHLTYILFLFSLALHSQETMSLEKAISIALDQNYGIKIGEKNIQIAENNNRWSIAGGGPIVDLNGSFSNVFVNDGNQASFIQGQYYSGSLGASLDAQWSVLNGGRVSISKDLLDLTYTQEKLNNDSNIHDVIKEVILSYYTVLLQQERRLVLDENLNLSKSKLEYELTKKEFGVSNSYSIIQFENAIISDSINLNNQENEVEVAKRNFNLVLNQTSYQDYTFPDKLAVKAEPLEKEKLKEILQEENYTLKTLDMIAKVNQLNRKLEQAANKPSLTLGASLGIQENAFKLFKDNPNTGDPFELNLSNRQNLGVNANLNWNLYDGHVRKTNIQNSKIQEEITQLNILEAKASLTNQIDILVENYENQLDQLVLTEKQVDLANQNLTMTEERFKNGNISSLDYQNVQNQLLVALFNKVNAIYSLLITKSDIDYLVGIYED